MLPIATVQQIDRMHLERLKERYPDMAEAQREIEEGKLRQKPDGKWKGGKKTILNLLIRQLGSIGTLTHAGTTARCWLTQTQLFLVLRKMASSSLYIPIAAQEAM